MKFLLITMAAVFLLFTSCGIPIDVDGSTKSDIKPVSICPPELVGDNIPDSIKQNIYSSITNSVNNMFDKMKKELDKQDTSLTSEVKLTKLIMKQLEIPTTKKDSNTLGMIKSLKVFIMFKGGDSRTLLAEVINNPSLSTEIDFKLIDKDIYSYLKKGAEIEIKDLTIRDCPKETIKIEVSYTATATL